MADKRSDLHEYPLAERLINDLIGQWLTRAFALASATTDDDWPANKILAQAEHHLAGFQWGLTPQIIDQLTRSAALRDGGER